MLNSAVVQSSVFRRLTNRETPRLAHPTAAAFDFEAWRPVLSQVDLSKRDKSLAIAAILMGMNIHILRKKYIDGVFEGLSGSEIAAFAVADANRTWAILKEKNQQSRISSESGVAYTAAFGKTPLDVGPSSGPAGADDLNTASIDTLSHWFARAADASADSTGRRFNYSQAGRLAQGTLSLEHAFREVWQEILWEAWSIEKVDGGWSVIPENPDDQALWRIWEWREQSLLFQHAALRHQIELRMPARQHPPVLAQTAVAIGDESEGRTFVLGSPGQVQTAAHRSAIETIENAYVGPFLDQPFAGLDRSVTPRLLELAICVLQDAAALLLPDGSDVEYRTAADIERLSCSVRRDDVISLVSAALGIDIEIATTCVDRLTSRPFVSVGPLFANGLWHRPLVATRDGTKLLLVNGALVWGSPLRRVERWLQEGSRADLSKTPLGLRYEAHLRQTFQEALNSNDLLASVTRPVTTWPGGRSGEEIDGLVRIGSTVMLLEIKCLLAPADPIERHDYVRKLEEACAQASRKAAWLKGKWGEVSASTGLGDSDESLRIVPLVVVNQSSGTGCRFGDCVVVDAHFLQLFFGSGSYRSGSVIEAGSKGRIGFTHQDLYNDAVGAEACIPDLFAAHPGLAAYRKAVRWEKSEIPLLGDDVLLMSFATMDVPSYAAAMPDPEDILPGSLASHD